MEDRLVGLPGGTADDAAVDISAASRRDRAGDATCPLRRDGVGIEIDAVETTFGYFLRHRLRRRRWTDADDPFALRTQIFHGAQVEEAVLLSPPARLLAAAGGGPAYLMSRSFRRRRQ